MESPSPPAASCSHEGQAGLCTVCRASVCQACAFTLPNHEMLCQKCLHRLRVAQAEENSPIAGATPTFNPGQGPLTLIFCVLLVLIYLASAYPVWHQANDAILDLTSLNLRAIVLWHQYWRLITANLMHFNVAHIGLNLFALFIFGNLLEAQIGWRMLFLWGLLSLIGCDIASIVFMVPNSVGASGIAYGLQTGFIVLSGKVMVSNRMQGILKTLQSLFGYLLLVVLLNIANTENVNTYGHMGGTLAGIACALIYPVSRPIRRRDYLQIIALILGAIVALMVIIA